MVGKKVGLLLLFISVGALFAAEDNKNKMYKQWHSASGNSNYSADIDFRILTKKFNEKYEELFPKDKRIIDSVLSKEKNDQLKILLDKANVFVQKQNEKLLPALKTLKMQWEAFFDILKLVKKEKETNAVSSIKTLQIIQDQLPAVYLDINTSGYSKLNRTKRARDVVGQIAKLLQEAVTKVQEELIGFAGEAIIVENNFHK